MSTAPPPAVALEDIASCFEGIIPASVCTCSRDGIPNLTYLSIVHRVDNFHVGLSYQFFNKTRDNVLQNPFVQVVVVSPTNLRQYRLDLRFERTETEGALFDKVKTRLDAVASQTGMSHIFRLRGVDIFQVLDCRPMNTETSGEGISRADYLSRLEEFASRVATCIALESIIDISLDTLSELFGYDHSFLMAPDEQGERLFTLASRGFGESGIGSEAWIGEGILGVAAERRAVVRTTNFSRDVLYSNAVRSALQCRGEDSLLEREIALPGLPHVESQLVVPIVAQEKLLGILCLQSATPGRFLSDDERVVRIAARQMAASMALLERAESTEPQLISQRPYAAQLAGTSTVKHYQADDSIFIDGEYLIKGIAGRIFWKLVQSYAQSGRVDFTNKEIRLDTSLQLPDFKDNLETRLILLRRRLQDRCNFLNLTQVGRGQFRLDVQRQLTLEEQS
ncbi:MAG TPA: GAF domain-containing protein [Bryobacteraceae bacterium]|nr:GAF domain-containing protein [Bryobacteraceae bacterium]